MLQGRAQTTRHAFADAPFWLSAARIVAEAVLAAILALIAAQAIWFVLYGTDAMRLPVAVERSAAMDAAPGVGLGATAVGLFAPMDQAGAPAVQTAPESTLGFTLRGVRGGAQAGTGSAIIDIPGQGQRLVAAGDALADGIVLEQVFADRVILNRRGARESLYLNDAARRRAQSGPATEPGSASYGERRMAEGWLSGVTLTPVLSDGAVRGLRVEGAAGPLADLGVQSGDVILTLNGAPLTSEAAVVRAFAQLDAADRAVARVERNGEIITVEASLR